MDQEFYLLFSVFNENLSWYLDENVKYFKHILKKDHAFDNHVFSESNRMHGKSSVTTQGGLEGKRIDQNVR